MSGTVLLIIGIGLTVILIWAYLTLKTLKGKPVTNLSFTFIEVVMAANKYKGAWTSSPTAYMVEKHQIVGKTGGGAETVLVDNLSSATREAFVILPNGETWELKVKTFFDNGAPPAETAGILVTSKNEQLGKPVENLAFSWVEYIP